MFTCIIDVYVFNVLMLNKKIKRKYATKDPFIILTFVLGHKQNKILYPKYSIIQICA